MTEGYSSPTQVLQKKFQEWFEDPVPADLPVPAETDHSNYETQGRQVYNLQKLLELFNFGFGGAVSLGACVGSIIFLINYSNFGGDPAFQHIPPAEDLARPPGNNIP